MLCICGCQAELPKTQYFRTQNTQKMLIICQIDWREVGVAFELPCLRNCTLSSFVCLSVSTVSAPPSAKCSPRWSVHPETYAPDARKVPTARTQRQCLNSCVADSSCVVAEWWDRSGCWVHERGILHHWNRGVTTFVINRQCDTTSGK